MQLSLLQPGSLSQLQDPSLNSSRLSNKAMARQVNVLSSLLSSIVPETDLFSVQRPLSNIILSVSSAKKFTWQYQHV